MNNARAARHREFYYQHLMAMLPQGVRWFWPDAPFYTGYEHPILFDWDQYFEGIILVYAGYPCDYIKNGVKLFLRLQEKDGFIPRFAIATVGERRRARDMVKPFLTQSVLLAYHQEKSLAWLKEEDLYERLAKYLDCWYHRFDVRGGGLSVWMDAGHTGMDNQHERAGGRGRPENVCEGVDLNAYLVREARAMSILAQLLGKEQDRRRFEEWAEQRARTIREACWDEAEGLFYDYHAVEKRPIRVKHVGAFATLWAGVATPRQAQRLVKEHLLNEKEFQRPWPIPALAASELGYVEGFLPTDSTGCCSWRAHTWMPTNYYTFQGLRRYGFSAEALQLAEKSFDLFLFAPFSEYYATESGIGTGRKPFRGWTALALFMENEHDLGVDPTELLSENGAGQVVRRHYVEEYR